MKYNDLAYNISFVKSNNSAIYYKDLKHKDYFTTTVFCLVQLFTACNILIGSFLTFMFINANFALVCQEKH